LSSTTHNSSSNHNYTIILLIHYNDDDAAHRQYRQARHAGGEGRLPRRRADISLCQRMSGPRAREPSMKNSQDMSWSLVKPRSGWSAVLVIVNGSRYDTNSNAAQSSRFALMTLVFKRGSRLRTVERLNVSSFLFRIRKRYSNHQQILLVRSLIMLGTLQRHSLTYNLDPTDCERRCLGEGNPDHRLRVMHVFKRDLALEGAGFPPIDYEGLSPVVLGWLKKVKVDGEEAVEALRQGEEKSSLTKLILQYMGSKRLGKLWFKRPFAKLFRRSDPSKNESTLLLINCSQCRVPASHRKDEWPTYEITSGRYVLHKFCCLSCPSSGSESKQTRFEPVDPAVLFIEHTALKKKIEHANVSD
ncbi:MAG: hypothetical protein M1830_001046, partial [Pleopsidium flavum]